MDNDISYLFSLTLHCCWLYNILKLIILSRFLYASTLYSLTPFINIEMQSKFHFNFCHNLLLIFILKVHLIIKLNMKRTKWPHCKKYLFLMDGLVNSSNKKQVDLIWSYLKLPWIMKELLCFWSTCNNTSLF